MKNIRFFKIFGKPSETFFVTKCAQCKNPMLKKYFIISPSIGKALEKRDLKQNAVKKNTYEKKTGKIICFQFLTFGVIVSHSKKWQSKILAPEQTFSSNTSHMEMSWNKRLDKYDEKCNFSEKSHQILQCFCSER